MRYDGVVVGGGPAGMMAAITAASLGQSVLLIERNDRVGKKLLITGKGRCNVTNNCTVEEVLKNIPRNGRFLYSALNGFSPEDVIAFFEDRGCPLKTERGNRVFPVSDRAESIADCLKRELNDVGVDILKDRAIAICVENGKVTGVQCETKHISCDWLILATGGLSYPTTGSTGDGYRISKALGHQIIPQEGSLVPLTSSNRDCAKCKG